MRHILMLAGLSSVKVSLRFAAGCMVLYGTVLFFKTPLILYWIFN